MGYKLAIISLKLLEFQAMNNCSISNGLLNCIDNSYVFIALQFHGLSLIRARLLVCHTCNCEDVDTGFPQ